MSAVRLPLQELSQVAAEGTMPIEIPTEFIRLLAYEKFEYRGRVDGHDVEDWLAAEDELSELFEQVRWTVGK